MVVNDSVKSLSLFVNDFIDLSFDAVAVLDHQGRLIGFNRIFQELFEIPEDMPALERLFGQSVGCIYEVKNTEFCNQDGHCASCPVYQILFSDENKQNEETQKFPVEKTMNIFAGKKEKRYMNLKVKIMDFYHRDLPYFIMTFRDQTKDNHRKGMEMVFLHDLINSAGAIYSLFRYMVRHPEKIQKKADLFEKMEWSSLNMLDDIEQYQKMLRAIDGELKLNIIPLNTMDIIENARSQIEYKAVAEGKEMITDKDTEELEVNTDKNLINRILVNMLKNAVEAEEEHSWVMIGAKQIDKGRVRFYVRNPVVIPEEIRPFIFTPKFSTKQIGRGFGTSSIKILGEKYLGGITGFFSNQEEGTVFYLDLNLNDEMKL